MTSSSSSPPTAVAARRWTTSWPPRQSVHRAVLRTVRAHALADHVGVTLSPARSGESGFTIIEVIVSAALMLFVAGGVLASMGTFSKASGAQRSRAQAAAVAQAALAQIRARNPATLASYVGGPAVSSPPTSANGITYTSSTTAAWVDEASGGAACSGAANITRYLRLTTTTQWSGVGGTKQTTASTLA